MWGAEVTAGRVCRELSTSLLACCDCAEGAVSTFGIRDCHVAVIEGLVRTSTLGRTPQFMLPCAGFH
eukprot:2118624-Amphidinium_carterae.2